MKKAVALFMAVILVAVNFTVIFADTPFQGYTYNFWGDLVPSPAAYIPVRSFGLSDLRCSEICGLHFGRECDDMDGIHAGLGELNEPTDLHTDSQMNIYIVDKGNNRIIVIDAYLNLIRVIDGYYRNGRWVEDGLNQPHGVFVTDNMEIYIADNWNHRVLVLDEDLNYIREITAPEEEGLTDDFEFLPLSVLVDKSGRTFVIVQRVFQGIMSFNEHGDFVGYYGTINVSFNWIDWIWRSFLTTREGRTQLTTWIPREFKGMDIDDKGFVYTAHIENWHLNNQIMRLNPRGEDVLVNFNDNVVINGDQGWRNSGQLSGHSILTDVVARSHGRYSALCTNRGRIYTYDSEGNLLYVFGGTGSMRGMVRSPVSIEKFGEDILLLDAQGQRGRIVHYQPTEYGNLINTAIKMRYDGHERDAVEKWRELVKLDENFALAWSGIGRSYLAAGDNVNAMYYLKRGMDVRYYSVAFRRNRLDVMQGTLPNILTGGVILIGLYAGVKIVLKIKGKGGRNDEYSS
jgi:DNA-binding beta-propeller fold protein YncE